MKRKRFFFVLIDLSKTMKKHSVSDRSVKQLHFFIEKRPSVDGDPVHIVSDPVHCKEPCFDEYTREPLPRDLVRQAIIKELQ